MSRRYVGLFFGFLLVPAILSGGGKSDRQFRLTLSSSLYRGVFDTVYVNNYTPTDYSALPGTKASQSLSLQGAGGTGISFSVVYYLTKCLGIRFSAGSSHFGIKGENSPYEMVLKYRSMMPPDYQPRDITHEYTLPWGRTEGKLKTLFATAGLEFRHEFSRILQASVSVCPGLYRVWGEFSPLGYTKFWLGGHSVLFVFNNLVYLKIPASLRPGLNLGAELTVGLGSRLFLWFRGGYDLVGRIGKVPTVDRAVDYTYGSPVQNEDLADISSTLALKKLRLSPSAVFVGAGLGIGF